MDNRRSCGFAAAWEISWVAPVICCAFTSIRPAGCARSSWRPQPKIPHCPRLLAPLARTDIQIGNFYAFKYVCQSRAEKYEKKNINYACLAHVIRHGGFMIIVAARLSAIPGHLTTAIFATCGQNIFIFSLAAFVTLPKQLVVVYLGVLFNAEAKSKTSQAISYTVLGIGAGKLASRSSS